VREEKKKERGRKDVDEWKLRRCALWLLCESIFI
jgi:hypothetical protein